MNRRACACSWIEGHACSWIEGHYAHFTLSFFVSCASRFAALAPPDLTSFPAVDCVVGLIATREIAIADELPHPNEELNMVAAALCVQLFSGRFIYLLLCPLISRWTLACMTRVR